MYSLLALATLLACCLAGPVPRSDNETSQGPIASLVQTLNSVTANQNNLGGTQGVLNALKQQSHGVTPTSPEAAYSKVTDALQSSPTPENLYATVQRLIAAGVTSYDINNFLDQNDFTNGNSLTNTNPDPPCSIYPRYSPSDVPYDLPEQTLRAAIHIPPTFQYGRGAQPILLVPGTGNTAFQTFRGNLIPLLQHTSPSTADPAWLNIPSQLLSDAQLNAEYVAYAISYLSSVTNRTIAVASWSQGGLIAQWAYKYFPSTRARVSDHVAFSPDYHGTVLANAISIPGEPLPPAVLQQDYNSAFVTTLRRDGGDEAYVPTTTVYSGFFDEIVEPQQGRNASAFLKSYSSSSSPQSYGSGGGVQAANYQVQEICRGKGPAAGFFTHEGTLYNNFGFEVLKDALVHEGPGNAGRLDLGEVCAKAVTAGLDVAEVLLTEDAILIAGVSLLTFPRPVFEEPLVRAKYLGSEVGPY